MATAGGTRSARSGGYLLAMLLAIFGCGDRHLTAILPPATGTGQAGEPNQPDAPLPSCGPGEGVGAGPLPPMGWNGWNSFGCGPALDQTKFLAVADALVESGMAAAGYKYMNLDDCWQGERAADGSISTNARFPDGLRGLGDYVHGKGLKLGLHTPMGGCVRPEMTTPGSQGHEAQDAQSYASAGVDFVKYNGCGGVDEDKHAAFQAMRDALDATGRPMLLSIVDSPFKYWQTEVGQMWRTHADVSPSWQGILDIVDATSPLSPYAGQGGYNDSDMLWIGNAGLSESESRACFATWAILASPLLAGNDLTSMSEATQTILTAREVIALDQDPLRLQGALISTQADVMVFAKPLAECGARGVVLLNRGEQSASARVTWQELGLMPGRAGLRDLWAGQELEPAIDELTLSVPPHDALALKVVGSEPVLPRGEVYLSDLVESYASNGWGPLEKDQNIGEKARDDGTTLMLDGVRYPKGLGTNSPALVRYRLGKGCRELSAQIGIDDDTGDSGSVVFQVWADGEKLFDSGVMTGATPSRRIHVDVTGRSELRLLVGEVDDYTLDRGDWADARLLCDE
jgi:alpha-galactosidase